MAKQRNIEQSSGQHLLEHLFQSQGTKVSPSLLAVCLPLSSFRPFFVPYYVKLSLKVKISKAHTFRSSVLPAQVLPSPTEIWYKQCKLPAAAKHPLNRLASLTKAFKIKVCV